MRGEFAGPDPSFILKSGKKRKTLVPDLPGQARPDHAEQGTSRDPVSGRKFDSLPLA
jgi:hypothetical protein